MVAVTGSVWKLLEVDVDLFGLGLVPTTMLGFLVNCVGFKPNRFPKVCMRDGLSAPVANDVEIGLSTTSRNLHVRTPLVPSVEISEKAGREVLLKLENVQPSGSFKIRGIGHLCSKAKANGTKRFVSSSGGNAGAAVAYAGALSLRQ